MQGAKMDYEVKNMDGIRNVNGDVRLNVQIKRRIYEQLRTISEYEGRSISDIVRVVLMDYIEEWHRNNISTLTE